ncbi:MAG: type II secretion system major pseudopilin GspG [Kiloniellales bacterium]|nr:type II secretion system major pseudopilin GspG [Kiloniellales bacterium]
MSKKLSRKEEREGGFTLLELLVVLAILSVLAALAVPRVLNYLGSAKTDAAAVQIERLGTVLDLYRLDVGRYPSEEDALGALMTRPPEAKGWNGPYLKKSEMLLDPWGRQFVYRHPGEHGDYDLVSLGADGQEGGEGEDRDTVSW